MTGYAFWVNKIMMYGGYCREGVRLKSIPASGCRMRGVRSNLGGMKSIVRKENAETADYSQNTQKQASMCHLRPILGL